MRGLALAVMVLAVAVILLSIAFILHVESHAESRAHVTSALWLEAL